MDTPKLDDPQESSCQSCLFGPEGHRSLKVPLATISASKLPANDAEEREEGAVLQEEDHSIAADTLLVVSGPVGIQEDLFLPPRTEPPTNAWFCRSPPGSLGAA